jgi:hypothetical protein
MGFAVWLEYTLIPLTKRALILKLLDHGMIGRQSFHLVGSLGAFLGFAALRHGITAAMDQGRCLRRVLVFSHGTGIKVNEWTRVLYCWHRTGANLQVDLGITCKPVEFIFSLLEGYRKEPRQAKATSTLQTCTCFEKWHVSSL